MRRPFVDFLSFCAILVETSQIHLLIECFTPEILETTSEATGKPAFDDLDAVPNVYQDEEPNQCEVVRDWRAAIHDNLVELSSVIDPDNGLLQSLLSAGVISEWNLDIFKVYDVRMMCA